VCPLLSGCLGAVAWPNVSVTPVLQVNASADQVHAFRLNFVDVDSSIPPGVSPRDYRHEWIQPLPPHEPSVCELVEIPVAAGGWVAPQGQIAYDYAWGLWDKWKVKRHSVVVRLYRPGCQTVEVLGWALPKEIAWHGVADLAGQEKAVDDLVDSGPSLFLDPALIGSDAMLHSEWASRQIAPGSSSAAHRKALLFAASEYERLAKSAVDNPSSEAIRDRMLKEAASLRERAEK
jgi:hypothetical protein